VEDAESHIINVIKTEKNWTDINTYSNVNLSKAIAKIFGKNA
jgi:hypothetical protein